MVLWTASTERYVDVREGLNMNADEILSSIARNDNEISPSNLFAVAAILEGAHYINGSPQNTLVPGIIDLAERVRSFQLSAAFISVISHQNKLIIEMHISARKQCA